MDNENLGRSVFSSEQAKKAKRHQPIPKVFLVREEDDRISMDRMDKASVFDLAAIAISRGQSRNPARNFYGWGVLTIIDAAHNGRSLKFTPIESNPYHAEICLNLPADCNRKELQMVHALELAAHAKWKDAPATEKSEG